MKKRLFILFVLFIGLSKVYALDYEVDTQAMIDLVNDEYIVNVAEGLQLDIEHGIYYLNATIRDDLTAEFPTYTMFNDIRLSVNPLENFHYQIEITNYQMCEINEYGYHEYCEAAISKQKEVLFTINMMPKDNQIDTIFAELDLYSSLIEFSDRFDNLPNVNAFTTFTTEKKMDDVAKKYNIKFINYDGFGGGIESNDKSVFTAFGRFDSMFVRDNNILGIYNICDIFPFYYDNVYRPSLITSSYDSFDDYMEAAMNAFPIPLLMPSYEIVLQDNGDKYTFQDEEYTVNVKSSYDDAIWQVKFSGRFKNDPVLKGDMNGNGKIDLQDIIMLLKLYLGVQ